MAARRQQQSKRHRLEQSQSKYGRGDEIGIGARSRGLVDLKSISIVSREQRRVLSEYLSDLERAVVGKLFSLYVCRQQSLDVVPRYDETIQINGLGSRGPIVVTMVAPYTSHSGIYASIAEFDRTVLRPLRIDLLQPLRSESIQPWIHTGLLEECRFQPDRKLDLIIRSQGYADEHAPVLGTIRFTNSSLNNRQLGTPADVPFEFMQRLREINASFGDAYTFYWTLGLGHCNDLLPYSPIHPNPHWSPARRIQLFQQMLFERAIKVDLI